MRKNTLWSTLLSVFLVSFMAVAYAEPAPDWVLKDSEGKEISSADYKGKPLILHFWGTWCPYCKKLQPGLDKIYSKYKEDGLTLLAISFAEKKDADPQKSLEERGHSFITLVNGEEVVKKFSVRGTPTTFFIDKKGEVIWMTNTSDPENPALEQAAQFILNEDA